MKNLKFVTLFFLLIISFTHYSEAYFTPPENYNDDLKDNRNMAQKLFDSDQKLTLVIQDAIRGKSYEKTYPDIVVSVRNGRVELSGRVRTPRDKSDIESRVRKIQGVQSIDNKIEVKSSLSIYED